MQLVLLAGELGEKYGTQHEYYNLHTPADAIKLLCINYPALKQELFRAHQNGIGYKVIQGGAAMGYDDLHLPFGSKPLLVVPVISGAGSGATTQILAGAGLIAASFLFPGAGLFGATSFFGATASTAAFVSPLTGIAYGSAVAAGAGIGTAIKYSDEQTDTPFSYIQASTTIPENLLIDSTNAGDSDTYVVSLIPSIEVASGVAVTVGTGKTVVIDVLQIGDV